jgi:hypothetical protein
MPEAQIIPDYGANPIQAEQDGLYRYARNTWHQAGTDNFVNPPAQNQDMLLVSLNTMPPITGVLMRRFAYRTFYPKLDTGSGDSL